MSLMKLVAKRREVLRRGKGSLRCQATVNSIER